MQLETIYPGQQFGSGSAAGPVAVTTKATDSPAGERQQRTAEQLDAVYPGLQIGGDSITGSVAATTTAATLKDTIKTVGGELKTGVHNATKNPTFKKKRSTKLNITLNQAKVIWDPKCKPKGLFGGHLNIRSILPKCDQIQHFYPIRTWTFYAFLRPG